MRILAIDTATEVCGIAVMDGDQLRLDYRLVFKNIHNEKLVPAIATLLGELGWSLAEIDAFAVAIGPGSFAGLRIGLSTAKGLAFSMQKPLAAVNTLDAFARGADFWRGPICVAMKARRGEFYVSCYENQKELRRVSDYLLMSTPEVEAVVKGETLVMVNPPEVLGELGLSRGEAAVPVRCLSSPVNVARLAIEHLEAGLEVNLQAVEPFYLKEFEAKKYKSTE